MKAYKSLRATVLHLEREHGFEASSDTQQLLGRLQSMSPAGSRPRTGRLPEVRFVGRNNEFGRMAAALVPLTVDGATSVSVVGEAGIGKSRLCEEFLRQAQLGGTRTLRAYCHADQVLTSFGVLAQLVLDGVRPIEVWSLPPVWRGQILSLLPELSRSGGPEARGMNGEPQRVVTERALFEAFAELFERLCELQPVLLYVDDLHWADRSSIAALAYLARRLKRQPILFLVTLRREHVSRRTEVAEFLAHATVPYATIDLAPLDRHDSFAVLNTVREQTQVPLSCETLDYIYGRTGGSPFLLIEYCRFVAEAQRAGRMSDLVALDGQLPDSVRAALGERVATVTKLGFQCLQAAAVLGNNATTARIAALVRVDRVAILAALRELHDLAVLQRTARRIAFAHELVREYILSEMDADTTRSLHARAAVVLSRSPSVHPGEVAIHAFTGGDCERACRYGIAAAVQSYRAGAYADVEDYLRLSVSASRRPVWRSEATCALAMFLLETRRFREATECFEEIGSWLEVFGSEDAAIGAMLSRIALAVVDSAEPRAVVLERARLLIDRVDRIGDEAAIVGVLRTLVSVAHGTGDYRVAIGLKEEVVDRAKHAIGKECASELYAIAAHAASMYGKPDEGAELGDLSVQEARDVQAPTVRVSAFLARGVGRLTAGLLEDASRDLDEALLVVERANLVAFRPTVMINLAVSAIETVEFERARQLLSIALRTANRHDELFGLANMGALEWEQGDWPSLCEAGLLLVERALQCHTGWGVIVGDAFVGLAQWELGHRDSAFEKAKKVALALEGNVAVGDKSYAGILVARMLCATESIDAAVRYLNALKCVPGGYARLAQWRLDVEHATLIAQVRPDEAWSIASGVMTAARKYGARAVANRAEALRKTLVHT